MSRLVQSIVTVDDRTLAITLRSQRQDAPLAFAHTDLAIARPVPGSAGRSARDQRAIASDRDSAVVVSPTTGDPLSIRFLVASGDPRDRLDKGVDLLLTRDPAALDYAATLPQFQSVPLAWQRTHVLLTPGRTRTSPSLSEDARHALADDAVRGEARGAVGPFWWQTLQDCEVACFSAARVNPSSHRRIVYDASRQPRARSGRAPCGLGSRFGLRRCCDPRCALSGSSAPDLLERAAGLTGEALAVARRRGTDAGYIIVARPSSARPVPGNAGLVEWRSMARSGDHRPAGRHTAAAIVRRGRSGVDRGVGRRIA